MTTQNFSDTRYEKMPYRRCGDSGLKLPAISLGFWQTLGKPGNEDLCRECCYYAFDNGVTHFDLANNYGPPYGNSELVVGKILKDMPRDELIVSTKAGFDMWPGPYGDFGSKKYLVASLDQSLKRMGLDYVDIFYHHRPDPGTPLAETLGALDLIVKQGKALYVGVSNYSGEQFSQAVEVVRENSLSPITIHQTYYNMFSRGGVENDLLPRTREAGTGVVAFCPLAQGLLTGKYLHGLPADSRIGRDASKTPQWFKDMQADGTMDKVARFNELAEQRGQKLAQMAMTWLLRDPAVASVISGVSKVAQLADNLAAANAAPLTPEELKKIDQIASSDG